MCVRKRERERERGRVAEERKEERGRVGGRGAKQSEALLDFVHFFVFLVGLKIPPFRCFYAVELFSGVQTLGALRVSSGLFRQFRINQLLLICCLFTPTSSLFFSEEHLNKKEA